MGLDACVYCDCFELGKLRSPPKPEWGAHVDPHDGSIGSGPLELSGALDFDAWANAACEHSLGRLIHHRLGNISLIGFFRGVLSAHVRQLPVITQKVIYSGSHGGDVILISEVTHLLGEIKVLSDIHASSPKEEVFLRRFERQLAELADCALRIGKPISF